MRWTDSLAAGARFARWFAGSKLGLNDPVATEEGAAAVALLHAAPPAGQRPGHAHQRQWRHLPALGAESSGACCRRRHPPSLPDLRPIVDLPLATEN